MRLSHLVIDPAFYVNAHKIKASSVVNKASSTIRQSLFDLATTAVLVWIMKASSCGIANKAQG